jgi:hypothetical protein
MLNQGEKLVVGELGVGGRPDKKIKIDKKTDLFFIFLYLFFLFSQNSHFLIFSK